MASSVVDFRTNLPGCGRLLRQCSFQQLRRQQRRCIRARRRWRSRFLLREDGFAADQALATDRTALGVGLAVIRAGVLPVGLLGRFDGRLAEQGATPIECFGLGAGVQAARTNRLHPRRGYMEKKPLQEPFSRQGHDVGLAASRLVFVVIVVVFEPDFALEICPLSEGIPSYGNDA